MTPRLFFAGDFSPVITAPPVWGYGIPLSASAENSFHIDSSRRIVSYEWDFDGDGTYDYQTAAPLDPAAQWTYPDPHPGVEGDPPAAITLRLRVTDDSLPPQTAASTFMLTVAEPPHAPYAEAGGPYICTVNEPCAVSGAGSYDIDPSDFITLYEWDLDLDGAPEIISPQPATNLLLEGGGFMPVTSGVPGQAGADTTTVADRALPPPPVFYRFLVE